MQIPPLTRSVVVGAVIALRAYETNPSFRALVQRTIWLRWQVLVQRAWAKAAARSFMRRKKVSRTANILGSVFVRAEK